MMKGVVLCILLLLFSGLPRVIAQDAQESAPPAASRGAPIVAVPETDFDFGEVQDGNEYVHAFAIWNTGTETLEIKKVVPD